MDARYQQRREKFDAYFAALKLVAGSLGTEPSPCGTFILETSRYEGNPDTWRYSRGQVRHKTDGTLLADVRRNHPGFWHAWITHSNGNRYLLCGEDYQGYTVIDLESGKTNTYFPDSGHEGHGFCWTAAYPSPDTQILAVDGCYWACPYEIVLFDFRTPEVLPYRELARAGDVVGESAGWVDNDTFAFQREATFRQRDSASYESLTLEEQAQIDRGEEKAEYKQQSVLLRRPELDP